MTAADATFLHIETAAHGGAFGHNRIPTPTAAQCAAGNYKVGRVSLYGLPIAIEQPRGTIRRGVDAKTGKAWESRMAAHYGYINGTVGADDDAVDVFVGFYPQADTAFVINQYLSGAFDEHKVLLAFPDEDAARRAYLNSYERGWQGLESIVPVSINQLKWWLKFGDMSRPLRASTLPYEGLETMTRKVQWDGNALPYDTTLDHVLYNIRCADDGDNLLLDSVTVADIIEGADEVLTLDAMVTPYSTLERKMALLRVIMERTGQTVKPVAVQITAPFKQLGVAQVAAIFELSDGQTVSVYFHNPDTTPTKLAPTDELISWKWLLNKKDITIVVAPERGADLNVREVARRILKLAEKNSAAFGRANAKRAERMQSIQGLKDECAGLEAELTDAQRELEEAKQAAAQRAAKLAADIVAKNAEMDGLLARIEDAKTAPDGEPLEPLMNAIDDIADEIRVMRGEPTVGRTPWAKWVALREAEKARSTPAVLPDGWAGRVDGMATNTDPVNGGIVDQNPEGWFVVPNADGIGTLEGYPTQQAAIDALAEAVAKKLAAGVPPSLVVLTGTELGQFPDTPDGKKALRAAAAGKLEAMIGTWVQCPALGGNVEIRRSGIKKTLSLSGDPRKLKLVAALDTLIGNASKLADKPSYSPSLETSIVAYHYLRAVVNLDGADLAVRFVIKEDDKGMFHWDHTVHLRDAVLDSAKENGPDGPLLGAASCGGSGRTGDTRLVSAQPNPAERSQNTDSGHPTAPSIENPEQNINMRLDSAQDKGHDESQPLDVTTTNGGGTCPSRIARHQLDSIVGEGDEVFNLFIEGEAPEAVEPTPPNSPLDAFEAGGGEPWQVTRATWVEIMRGHMASLGQTEDDVRFEQFHHDAVKVALDAGKPVPAEVLADYPGMKAETDAEKEARYATAESNLNALLAKASGENPTDTPPPAQAEDPIKTADRALFQSVIDGTVPDILAPDLADQLEAAYMRQQGDPELVALFEHAVGAYQDAMLSATSQLA